MSEIKEENECWMKKEKEEKKERINKEKEEKGCGMEEI